MKKNAFAFLLGSAVIGLLAGIVLFVLISAKDVLSFDFLPPNPGNNPSIEHNEGPSDDSPKSLDLSGLINGGASDGSNEETLILEILADSSGEEYLRVKSFGNYSGNKWENASSYNKTIDSRYSMNYLTGIALNLSHSDTLQTKRIEIRNRFEDYFLPYYLTTDYYLPGSLLIPDMNYTAQSSDVYYVGDTENPYSLRVYDFNQYYTYKTVTLSGEYASYESEYRQFVYNNYLSVPAQTRSALSSILASEGIVAGGNDLIEAVAELVASSATYNGNYDPELDNESDIVLAFLQDYKEGVCQHFASAATLFYRTLGIPARYVVGCVGETVAGSWVEVTTKTAHAWTEVYVDGLGWVKVEVTPGGVGGGISENTGEDPGEFNGGNDPGNNPGNDPGNDPGNNPGNNPGEGEGGNQQSLGSLTIKPVNVYYLYDGETAFSAVNEVAGLSSLLRRGYTYQATVSGTRQELGITDTVITDFKLYDQLGNDVTENYEIEFSTGILQVYYSELSVSTDSSEKVYDGAPLNGSFINLDSSELMPSHRASELLAIGSRTNVGTSQNGYYINITDEDGNDVTDYYRITADYGTLTVTHRAITINVASATKVYDGVELTCADYEIGGERLCPGDYAEVIIEGSQTNVGMSDNDVSSVKIYNSDGVDVTNNYTISVLKGTLTVKRY